MCEWEWMGAGGDSYFGRERGIGGRLRGWLDQRGPPPTHTQGKVLERDGSHLAGVVVVRVIVGGEGGV